MSSLPKVLVLSGSSPRHKFLITRLALTGSYKVFACIQGKQKERKAKKKSALLFKTLVKHILNFQFKRRASKFDQYRSDSEIVFFGSSISLFNKLKTLGKIIDIQIPSNTSLNSSKNMSAILNISPDIIVVFGTILLSESWCNNKSDIPILNIHTGLSPFYRGGHTNLHAWYREDFDYVGITLHELSADIDGGDIYLSYPLNHNRSPVTSNWLLVQSVINPLVLTINSILSGRETKKRQDIQGLLFKNKDFDDKFKANLFSKILKCSSLNDFTS